MADEILRINVKPNANKSEVVSFNPADKTYVVKIKAMPENGKANKELIKFFSKELGIKIEIVSGHASRKKLARIRVPS